MEYQAKIPETEREIEQLEETILTLKSNGGEPMEIQNLESQAKNLSDELNFTRSC